MSEKGLTVRELLKKTHDQLVEKHLYQEIVFPEEVWAEIADDTDWHRSRTGYMSYDKVNLCKFTYGTWGITRGEKCGSYPADPYDSDILALQISTEGKTKEEIQKELHDEIYSSTYFRNSLIYGMADGELRVGPNSTWFKNPFQKRMLELLRPEISSYIEQKLEHDPRYISLSTLSHVVTKAVLYKPSFVDFLTKTIETVLEEQLFAPKYCETLVEENAKS